jgi:predicted exporter
MASLGGLAITAFPAFREMSFFAGVGVLAALAVSLGVLPDLLGGRTARLPARSAAAARSLAALLARLETLPRPLLVLPLALAGAALPLLGSLHWQDDMSRLTSFDPGLVQEEQRVRERVAGLEADHFVIGLAAGPAEAVALSDRIHARLAAGVLAGELAGLRSLHALLWSEDLQRRNWQALHADPELAARLDAAFAAEGFRPGAFEPFRESLAGAPPAPLRLADLETSPLSDLISPFVIPVGEKLAVVTYLQGLEAPEALAARLADLPDVHLMDQRSFVNDVYREFRQTTLRQMLLGAGLVVLLLALRYRAWRPVLASFLPSLGVVALVLGGLALFDVPLTLLHVLALILVTGMGVDYGIFLVDSTRGGGAVGATMLSLLLSCLTTAFVFGTLALSEQPALRAIGVTTGLGILLSYLLAPVALAASGLRGRVAEREAS